MREKILNLERNKIVLILEWYKHKFGKSKFYKKPIRLRIYKSEGKSEDKDGLRGSYDYGKICVYLGSITNIKELCQTIGHEYKHYLMDQKEHFKITKKLSKIYGEDEAYLKHSHENRCRRFELKWGNICFNELKSKLYKK
jgi:uncharacterized protein YjaZ